MLFSDIKTFTYIGTTIIVDGVSHEITTPLSSSITAVQYHHGYGMLEEPLMKKVKTSKYDSVLQEWVLANTPPVLSPTQILSNIKMIKLQQINADFDAFFATGYTTSSGITMGARRSDITQLDDGYRLALRGGETTLLVRGFDNVNHVLPLADVDTMIIELGQNWQTQLQRLWAAKDKINKARTKTSIDKIIL